MPYLMWDDGLVNKNKVNHEWLRKKEKKILVTRQYCTEKVEEETKKVKEETKKVKEETEKGKVRHLTDSAEQEREKFHFDERIV